MFFRKALVALAFASVSSIAIGSNGNAGGASRLSS